MNPTLTHVQIGLICALLGELLMVWLLGPGWPAVVIGSFAGFFGALFVIFSERR